MAILSLVVPIFILLILVELLLDRLYFKKPPGLNAKTYQKHDVSMPAVLDGYLLVQSALLLIATGTFLLNFAHLTVRLKISLAVLIYIHIFSLGVLFDGKRLGLITEIIRFVLSGSLLLWLSYNIILPSYLYFLYCLISLLSIPWCYYSLKKLVPKSTSFFESSFLKVNEMLPSSQHQF